MTRFPITCFLLPLLLAVGCQSVKQASASAVALRVYQFEDLDSLMQVQPRPVAVFLHAPWCQYCRNMEQHTLAHPAIIEQLNEQYYYISFDGETESSVTFQGQTFVYKPTGRNTGTHELAYALGQVEGQLVYPTFVMLNPSYEIIFQHQAFLRAQALQEILTVAQRQ